MTNNSQHKHSLSDIRDIPIGISEFSKLREKKLYFIDKSFFIKDFLKSSAESTLITRPRRFGKTINMTMIEAFMDCDKPQNASLFEGLEISKDTEFCQNFMSQYPVIFLSLKEALFQNKSQFLIHLQNNIASYLKNKDYLFKSDKLSIYDKERLSLLCNTNPQEAYLQGSLRFLSSILSQHHNKPVILLIDEYDAPIYSARKHNQYEECVDFMRGFLGAGFKDNSHLFKGLLTGVLRISQESLFSSLNNLQILTVGRGRFSNAFGITQPELDKVLIDFGLEHYKTDLANWYNGYQIGNTTSIYNPWSILKWLDDPDHLWLPHWINTASPVTLSELFLKNVDILKGPVLTLLTHGRVTTTLNEHIVLPQLDKSCTKDDFLNLLWHSGYITPTHREFVHKKYSFHMVIPNEEVRIALESLVTDWLSSIKFTVDKQDCSHIITALEAGDMALLESQLNHVITNVTSYHDFAKHSENAFHCLLAGFFAWLEPSFRVTSNREGGLGRFDILLVPRNKTAPGYVLEVKAWSEPTEPSAQDIEKCLAQALLQIKTRKYTTALQAEGVSACIPVGLLFHQKKMWMAWESA